MDESLLAQILLRLDDDERKSVRFRKGVVIDVDPLVVDLGSAGINLTMSGLRDMDVVPGDDVACLTWGRDALCLGSLSGNGGLLACRRYRGATYNVGDNVAFTVALDTTNYDTGGMASGSGILIPEDGLYSLKAVATTFSTTANSVGYTYASIEIDGTSVAFAQHWPASAGTHHRIGTPISTDSECTAGQLITLASQVDVNAGTPQVIGGTSVSFLSVHRIGPLVP